MSRFALLRLSPEQAPLVDELLRAKPEMQRRTVTFERAGVDEETGEHHGARLRFDVDPPKPGVNEIPDPWLLLVSPDGGDMGRGQQARRFSHSFGDVVGFIALEGEPLLVEKLALVSPHAYEIGGETTFPIYGTSGGVLNRSILYLTFTREDLSFEDGA